MLGIIIGILGLNIIKNIKIATILKINKANLMNLQERKDILLFSSEFFIQEGYYLYEDRYKKDLTEKEYYDELIYLNKKERTLIKLIGEKNED